MSRRWNNIKEKKAVRDKNTSRIYAKFGREIYVAAKQGEADPELNQTLKFVIERAKTYNVPKHIIDRAVDKAKGGADETFSELRYEGFGPSGSMVIVDTLSDNVNRTAAEVRAAFNKNGGNMGVSGSVSYMFSPTAVFAFEGKTGEEVLEILLDADVDVRDILAEEEGIIVHAEPDQFHAVSEALKNAGITEFAIAEMTMLPQTEITLFDADLAQFEKLIDVLEDLDDVNQVYHNVEM